MMQNQTLLLDDPLKALVSEKLMYHIVKMFEQSKERKQDAVARTNKSLGEYLRCNYCDKGLARLCPESEQILLAEAIDIRVLSMLPFAISGLSKTGTYTVVQNGRKIGNVVYSGEPEQDNSSNAVMGVITSFAFDAPADQYWFELVYDTKFEHPTGGETIGQSKR